MKSPIKYPGGKAYLAPKHWEHAPKQFTTFVEPFCGSCAFMLANPTGGVGVSETANDIDGDVIHFFRTLCHADTRRQFIELLADLPVSEQLFNEPVTPPQSVLYNPFWRATQFFIRCRQSFGAAGKTFATPTVRLRAGMNEHVSAQRSAVLGLPEVADRLSRVMWLNRDALDVIRKLDTPDTFMYVDPQYLLTKSSGFYRYPFDEEQHRDMCLIMRASKSKFMVCGYDNPLYRELLRDWRRLDFLYANHQAGGREKSKETESVWLNY